jgi:hypothetical protein
MKVSSSGYYNWLNRGLSDRDIENQQLTKSIREVFGKKLKGSMMCQPFSGH